MSFAILLGSPSILQGRDSTFFLLSADDLPLLPHESPWITPDNGIGSLCTVTGSSASSRTAKHGTDMSSLLGPGPHLRVTREVPTSS
jgi:hypothetical protein